MESIKRMPLTIYGVMVALASLGNLLASYGNGIKYFCGICACLVLVALILRVIFFFEQTKKDLENPLIRSITPTVSMSLMILSTYLKPFAPGFAYGLWIFAICLFVVTIIWFAAKFILHFNIQTVFPSWFAVSAGGVVASVTCGAYGAQPVGKVFFWIGFIASCILFPIVFYRMFVVKNLNKFTIPTYYIFGAPFNLCMAGYINAYTGAINLKFLYVLLALALITIIPCIIALPFLNKKPFYPAYAGFAFTTAISAVAIKAANAVLTNMTGPVPALALFSKFMDLLAFVVVFYVFIRYIIFSCKKPAT